MHKKKRSGKRIAAAVLSAIMLIGSAAGSMPVSVVHAAEVVTEQEKSISENVLPNEETEESVTELLEENAGTDEQESDEENWHVLGRPMTEDEEEEQLRLIEYYRSLSGEVPQEEGKDSLSLGSNDILSGYGKRSQSTAEQTSVDLPKKYSSVEQGYTPAIRNQNPYGTCWAHASIALQEISMVKNKLASADNLSLSLPHAIYYYYRPVTDPLGGTADDYREPNTSTVYTMYNAGGGSGFFAETTTAWMGPVLEEDFYNREYLMTYHNEYNASSELNTVEQAYGKRAATVTEMVYVNVKDQEELKRAILEYGAVGIDYLSSSEYYNPTYAAQYCPYVMGDDHAVAVVGWNDYYPKENFSETPMKDGAWLVRNSWGTGHGDRGYFWLSYEDKSTGRNGRAYRVEEADKYDNNYQYDGVTGVFEVISCSADKNLETVNVFEIQKERELLKAILFQTWEADYQYSIQIYKNPQDADDPASGEPLLDTPLTGVKERAGRYTIDLEQPIWLEQGDKIAVSVTYSSSDSSRSLIAELDRPGTGQTGRSFYRMGDEAWTECAVAGKSNFIIKAFTDNAEGTHIHQWSEEWSYDGDAHWHACTGAGTCDASLSHEDRAYAEHYGGTATCIARAKCADCNQEYGRIPTDQHTGDEVCTVCGEDIAPEDRKGVVNPSYEFTTINEEKISSAANGKPKLIIMFGAKCSISSSTMTDLISEKLPGVDICAVETNFYQKTDVEAFRESLGEGPGKDNIQFCYAPEDGMSIRLAYTGAYREVYPNADVSPLPIICYIDEQNNFKYMTAGQQDADQIKKNLITYCGYDVNNLDVANPSDATFTTIEDTEVSLKAEDRPKVLVFFQAEGCRSSQEALFNIGQNVPRGIDIHAIEMLGRDKETVANFKNTYTGAADGIDYCYGKVSIDEVLSYMQAANLDTGQIKSPVVCYIDADNNLQYVSTGVCTNEEVRRILSTCCDFDEPGVPTEPTPTPTPPVEPEPTPEPTPTPTPTPEPTPPVEPTPTPTPPVEPNPTPTPTPPVEPTPEPTPPVEPNPTPTPTPPVEPNPTPTPTPPVEPNPTPTPTPPVEPNPTPTPTPPVEPNPTPTPTPPVKPEPTPPVEPNPTPPADRTNPFTDVDEGAFYYDPVLWAVNEGITTGVTPTAFIPNRGCTRAEIVTLLYRAMNGKVSEDVAGGFTDVKEGTFYYDAVLWAIENNITTGVTPTTFEPDQICTRAEIVTFLCRAINGEVAEDVTCGFTDVKKDAFYYNAVLWAIEEGITTGVTETTFVPGKACTRGECVTFLYRMLEKN